MNRTRALETSTQAVSAPLIVDSAGASAPQAVPHVAASISMRKESAGRRMRTIGIIPPEGGSERARAFKPGPSGFSKRAALAGRGRRGFRVAGVSAEGVADADEGFADLGESAGGGGLRLGAHRLLAEFLARAFDREAARVQEVLDAKQQLDVAPPVQAVLGAGLAGLEDAELGFPVAKHVRLYADDAGDLADLEVELVAEQRRDGFADLVLVVIGAGALKVGLIAVFLIIELVAVLRLVLIFLAGVGLVARVGRRGVLFGIGEVGGSGRWGHDAASSALIVRLRTWLGLNESTRRPEITISSPVCGLRPLRGRFSLITKLPNPEILTFSPCSRRALMTSKIDSTTSAASFLENPTRS